MKKEFSNKWKASKQPRKQRKYLAKAPLHIKRKFLNVNLSRNLRKKHEKRNLTLRKGDVVKIMRGKFRKKSGKVSHINPKNQKINVDGISIKKRDGSKVNVNLKPSNLQIIELNLEDKKRLKNKEIKKEDKKNASKKTKSS